jgi:hypothetical protein
VAGVGGRSLCRAQGRKLQWEALDVELVDVLGSIEVLEAMLAEVAEADSRQLVILEDGAGRLRKQYLPAVPRRRDPRRAMDAETVVALVADAGLARVHAHSHTTLHSVRPGMLGERALRRACGQRGVRGLAKGDEEGVALRVDLLSAVLFEGGAQDPAVLGQHLAVPVSQLLEQAGRALDVREEEGDGPARELGHPRVQFTTVSVGAPTGLLSPDDEAPPRRTSRRGRDATGSNPDSSSSLAVGSTPRWPPPS